MNSILLLRRRTHLLGGFRWIATLSAVALLIAIAPDAPAQGQSNEGTEAQSIEPSDNPEHPTDPSHPQENQPRTEVSAPPTPIPVELVETSADRESRLRREELAVKRELQDLAAQQGMNAATQSIDAATQDMRDYAFISLWLVAAGTVLLACTLYLTRQANKAAQEAVKVTMEIGQKQVRANLGFFGVEIIDTTASRRPYDTSIEVCFKNTGQSPARDVCFDIVDYDELIWSAKEDKNGHLPPPTFRDFDSTRIKGQTRRFCGAGQVVKSHYSHISRQQIEGLLSQGRFPYICGWVRYKDDFWLSEDDYRFVKFCLCIQTPKGIAALTTQAPSSDTISVSEHGPDNYTT